MLVKNQNQIQFQELDDKIQQEVREGLREWLADPDHWHGVVHFIYSQSDGRVHVEVNDNISLSGDEVAIIFFNRGEHYIIICSASDGDYVEVMGDAEKVRKYIKEMYEEAKEWYERDPNVNAEFDIYIAEAFFLVDETLTAMNNE